jgi:hypothetical protein
MDGLKIIPGWKENLQRLMFRKRKIPDTEGACTQSGLAKEPRTSLNQNRCSRESSRRITVAAQNI